MRHSSAATRSKPELKVGKFVEEDDSASQGESSDRLSVVSMSTAYWRVNSLAIVGAAIALISVFLPLVGNLRARRVQRDALCPLDALESARFSGPPQTRPARFPINNKHLSDIHHFKPHSADSSPGRGITRPRWRPTKYFRTRVSRTGSINLNTNRLHHHYSLRDIQLLPIVPLCALGPVGNGTVFGTAYTWGFETGFYIFIVGIVVFALSLVLNNSLARTTAIRRAEVSVLTSQPTG